MNFLVIVEYIVFSLILFLVLNILNRDENNDINYIVISLIYIIVISGIIKYKEFIFLILVFEFIIRIFYNNYVLEKNFFKENSYCIKRYIITIIIGYFMNIYFIDRVDSVFLTGDELKIIIWLFIIIYGYFYIKGNSKFDFIKKKKKNDSYREYVIMMYATMKDKYYEIVKSKYSELIFLVYAIMIYNNYMRPKFYRKIDNIKFKLDFEDVKLGIMQVKSKKNINDEDSIKLGIKMLEKLYSKYSCSSEYKVDDIIIMVVNGYYEDKDVSEMVINTYKYLMEFEKK